MQGPRQKEYFQAAGNSCTTASVSPLCINGPFTSCQIVKLSLIFTWHTPGKIVEDTRERPLIHVTWSADLNTVHNKDEIIKKKMYILSAVTTNDCHYGCDYVKKVADSSKLLTETVIQSGLEWIIILSLGDLLVLTKPSLSDGWDGGMSFTGVKQLWVASYKFSAYFKNFQLSFDAANRFKIINLLSDWAPNLILLFISVFVMYIYWVQHVGLNAIGPGWMLLNTDILIAHFMAHDCCCIEIERIRSDEMGLAECCHTWRLQPYNLTAFQ